MKAPARTPDQELKKLIPKKVKKYHPRKLPGDKTDIEVLKKAFKKRPNGHPQNTLLIGPTGAGKTHAVKKVAEKLKMPIIRVNLNRMTTVEDFVGQWVPEQGGNFKWEDGVLTRLMKNGGLLMVDEINAAPPEILFVLHSALDFREITLTQKDGEIIEANKDFWFIATMNPDYKGTSELNEALRDRFKVILEYPYDEEVENRVIKDKDLIKMANKLRKMSNNPTKDIRTPVSTRMLIQYEENKKVFGEKLALNMLVNKFKKEERRAVKEIAKLHLIENDD
ncbi:MAG: MoxR-like ATPase [Candidatus Methanohalarchaeum thermophilum]|uniref:MoxR-like ATPase n=1 Tax=Methanohalarchaeum thermophilum TaxID=1903181 RepID=A0A1Q6DVZ5_METT1|nr:MAG: MoxR-like ATPase [Candidatus Methanohalarchaeum thermophilum]